MISGRGSNMKAILESIRRGEVEGVGQILVISNKSDALGLEIAEKEYGVKTVTVLSDKNDESFESKLKNELKNNNICPHNGLICLAGFMKILSPSFVELYKYRIMNVHPSLLPSFKGLHAQKQALLAGVKISGCTVHFVDNRCGQWTDYITISCSSIFRRRRIVTIRTNTCQRARNVCQSHKVVYSKTNFSC